FHVKHFCPIDLALESDKNSQHSIRLCVWSRENDREASRGWQAMLLAFMTLSKLGLPRASDAAGKLGPTPQEQAE
ncbi:MAG: hypothetical protein FWD08_07230, partial [Alphaproteobacteria bacterium]|nr:hypothetical protein [Alphaproteobacteria bacterium]